MDDRISYREKKELPDEVTDNLIVLGTEKGIEFNAEQWERSQKLIRAMLTGLIARDLYENASYYRHLTPLLKDYGAALDLIRDKRRYKALLEGEN